MPIDRRTVKEEVWMALWMVRTGRHGEHEKRFLETNRIYVTWKNLRHDLSALGSKQELRQVLQHIYPDKSKAHIVQNSGQVMALRSRDETRRLGSGAVQDEAGN